MPDFGIGLLAGSSLLSSGIQADAAGDAADAQAASSAAGIAEQRRQFDEVQRILAPYVNAGTNAIGGFQPYQQAGATAFQKQQALAGLLGQSAQRSAIAEIEGGAGFRDEVRQGEEALLANASATGGLRGGNLQGALAQFRPQMLNQAIERQYGRLGGFASAGLGVNEALYRGGQASATGQASSATALGGNVANLLAQSSQPQAQATLKPLLG